MSDSAQDVILDTMPRKKKSTIAAAYLGKLSAKGRDMAALGMTGGLKGGPARAAALSKKRRTEIAKAAAAARWGKGK